MSKLLKWFGIIWLLPIFITIPINNFFSILTIILLPLVIIYNLSNKGFLIEKSTSHILFIVFILYIFLTGVFKTVINEEFEKYFILYSEGFLVYYIITSIYTIKDINLLANSLVTFCLISFIIGLVQYQLEIGQEYLEYSSGRVEMFRRPIPAGFDPNYYFLNIIFPLVYSLNNLSESNTKIKKIFNYILILTFITNAIFTNSKSALIVTIILCLFFIFKNKKSFIITTSIIYISYLFLFPILIEFLPSTLYRYESLFSRDFQRITSSRNIMWAISYDFFLSNPLFGNGLGQMVKHYSSILYFKQIGGQSTHNTFIHTIAETGIIGFFLLFTPLFIQIKNSFTKNKLIFMVLVGTSIMMMSIDAGYYKTYYVYLSISYIINKNEKNTPNSSLRFLR
jgi:O-antigen ligase